MSREQDRYAMGWGIITDATVNTVVNGYPTVNVRIKNQTIPGDNTNVAPLAMPCGFFCIPDDGTHTLTLNIQSSNYNSIALTQAPALFNFWPINGMSKGESALYSRGYSLQANNNGLHAQLSAITELRLNSTATMLWGENITKVLQDILGFLIAQQGWLSNYVSAYNLHQHTNSGGNTTPPLTPYNDPIPPQGNLPQDQTDLTAGKGYISDTGALM